MLEPAEAIRNKMKAEQEKLVAAEIQEAMEDNRFECDLDFGVTSALRKKLRQLGYSVTGDGDSTTVSWFGDDKEDTGI